MQLLTITPHNSNRFRQYAYLLGAMKALARPNESAMRHFAPGVQILGIEDISNVVTVHYRSKAALVQYSGLLLQAWKLAALSFDEPIPFLRHVTPDGALVVGNPNFRPEDYEARVEVGHSSFQGDVYPNDGDRVLSLGMVLGALRLQGHADPIAKDAPKLIGHHITAMGWESGIVYVEWASSEAFLAYSYIVMYAWRVAGNKPAPGTIRHTLPDRSRIECNLWDEDPWKMVTNVINSQKKS